MILGFAHLAVNVSDLGQAETTWFMHGYKRNALHLNVPNHLLKQRFFTDYRPYHDLMLLTGSGLWPLELTLHGPLYSNNTQITWGHDAITIKVVDPAVLSQFFIKGLGFHEEDNYLVLNGLLPGWSCRLQLMAGIENPVSLESAGPTCLAFYCTGSFEDTQQLIDIGATDNTGTFDLTLGEKDMTISMVRAPGGPLLELINIKNKK
jgi:hypothetical protein